MLAKNNVLLCFALMLSGFSCQVVYGQANAAPAADGLYTADQAHRGETMRSEERRVGKECVP